jgi:FkbM family methyltransferase
MKKVFLDCGTHLCEGLKDFIGKKIVTEDFEIHTFEANPACNIIERIKQIPYNVTPHQKAVWIEDGTVFFNQENHRKSRSGSPHDGQSDVDGWGSSIDNIGFIHPGYETKVEVESISLSNFLQQYNDDDYIVCKMDIEGSEFAVLRDLLEKGSIKKINELYVEFHERFMPKENEQTKNELVNQITSLGINLHQWF